MTEFTKLKIGFALALLGTLFTLHPFLDRFDEEGFLYLGYNLKIIYPYALAAGLLSLCVYCYAIALLGERPHSWSERTGNHAYALAILILPIYGGLFVSAKLADYVALSHVAWAAPAVAAGLGAGWVLLSQFIALRIRGRLGEQDRLAKIAQLAHQEVTSLNRARELCEGDHYDLCVVEVWRALEARLRQILLARHVTSRLDSADAVLHAATRRGILREPVLGIVNELRRHWCIAVSTEPLSREAAEHSLSAARHVLAVTPVWPAGEDQSVILTPPTLGHPLAPAA
jgi:hypothetical protein